MCHVGDTAVRHNPIHSVVGHCDVLGGIMNHVREWMEWIGLLSPSTMVIDMN